MSYFSLTNQQPQFSVPNPINGPTLAQQLAGFSPGNRNPAGGAISSQSVVPVMAASQSSMVPTQLEIDPISMPDLDLSGSTPGGGGAGGFFGDMSFADKASLVLAGLNSIGNIWGGMEARGLAKKQFDFTKDVTNTNLNNQIKSYNTALADRARSRAQMEGQSQSAADSYVEKNRLTRSGS